MTDLSRYDQLGPVARALVDDYDAIDLATMLVKAQDDLAALRAVARGYCPHCGRGDATPTTTDWEQQKQRAEQAEAAIARVRALHRKATHGDDCVHCAAFGSAYDNTWPCQTIRVLDGTASAPPIPAAADIETTARVFAALHQSAEQDVTRVINLYERWVKAGSPPLGGSVSRWWDGRLAELHDVILPPEDQPEGQS